MHRLLFLSIEIIVYVFAVIIVIGARKEGNRWLSTLFWAMVFGTVTELLITHSADSFADQSYVYGNFLLEVNWGSESRTKVPLWVGIGWGCIVYAATWTAQRLELPRFVRPLAAGVLAVNVDFALDPVAHLVGFWTWQSPASNAKWQHYYHVPYDNYLGWFAIVASYGYFVPWFFRIADRLAGNPPRKDDLRFVPGSRAEWIVPPLAALAASVVLVGIRMNVHHIYEHVAAPATLFLLLFNASVIGVVYFARKAARDNPPNKSILAIPIFFHTYTVLALTLIAWTSSGDASPKQVDTTLLVAVPSHLVFGVFAYGWPSLEKLFPAPHRDVRRKYQAAARIPAPPQLTALCGHCGQSCHCERSAA